MTFIESIEAVSPNKLSLSKSCEEAQLFAQQTRSFSMYEINYGLNIPTTFTA